MESSTGNGIPSSLTRPVRSPTKKKPAPQERGAGPKPKNTYRMKRQGAGEVNGQAIQIARWGEVFENAYSRTKVKRLAWFPSPAGCDSAGYLALSQQGRAGFCALGVFQALCQAYAGHIRTPSRADGVFVHSSGKPMTVAQIALLARVDFEILSDALSILSSPEVGWVLCSNGNRTEIEQRSNGNRTSFEETNKIPAATGARSKSSNSSFESHSELAATEAVTNYRTEIERHSSDARTEIELQESTHSPARAPTYARTREAPNGYDAEGVPIGAPSRAEVLAHAEVMGWPEDSALRFFLFYNEKKWLDLGFDVRRWKDRMERWVRDDHYEGRIDLVAGSREATQKRVDASLAKPPPNVKTLAAKLGLRRPDREWEKWSRETQAALWQEHQTQKHRHAST